MIERVAQMIDESDELPQWVFDTFLPRLKKLKDPVFWPELPAVQTEAMQQGLLAKLFEITDDGGDARELQHGAWMQTSLGRIEDMFDAAGQASYIDSFVPMQAETSNFLILGSQTYKNELMIHLTTGHGAVPNDFCRSVFDTVVQLIQRMAV